VKSHDSWEEVRTISSRNGPLGPNGTWKTGQRVPATGTWEDQYGQRSVFHEHGTFITCIGRKGEVAFRKLVRAAGEMTA
jgi:hypothetical protein